MTQLLSLSLIKKKTQAFKGLQNCSVQSHLLCCEMYSSLSATVKQRYRQRRDDSEGEPWRRTQKLPHIDGTREMEDWKKPHDLLSKYLKGLTERAEAYFALLCSRGQIKASCPEANFSSLEGKNLCNKWSISTIASLKSWGQKGPIREAHGLTERQHRGEEGPWALFLLLILRQAGLMELDKSKVPLITSS